MVMPIFSLRERPELTEAMWNMPNLSPRFMLDDPLAAIFFGRLPDVFPDFQLVGLDDPVREYVEASEGLNEFYDRLIPLLDYLLPSYVREGKAHLTVGVGCTNGKHPELATSACPHIAGRADGCRRRPGHDHIEERGSRSGRRGGRHLLRLIQRHSRGRGDRLRAMSAQRSVAALAVATLSTP